MTAGAHRRLPWPTFSGPLFWFDLAKGVDRLTLPAGSCSIWVSSIHNKRKVIMSKALIVDDSRTDAYVSQKCADQLFDEVKMVGTLQELLQVVPTFKPDVIFMDVYLGEWHNGLSHIRELRSGHGELSITPIIVLSSKAAEEDKRLAVEAGAAGYIVKPATLDKMMESLRRYVPGFIPKGWESVIA